MTHKARRLLFYGLVITFLLLGVGVVLYAKGWRFDPQTLSVSTVGGLYVRTFPEDALLSLNEIPIERPFRLFDKGILVNNLFPKTYHLTALHEGYLVAHRTVAIEPSRVTEAKYIVLVPAQEVPAIPGPLVAFELHGGKPLVQSTQGVWRFESEELPGREIVGAAASGAHLITAEPEAEQIFWYDLNARSSTAIMALLERSFRPTEREHLTLEPLPEAPLILVRTPTKLSLVDPDRGTVNFLTPPVSPTGTITAAAAGAEVLAWSLTAPGATSSLLLVARWPLAGTALRELRTVTLERPMQLLRFAPTGDLIGALDQDRTFFLYDVDRHTLTSRGRSVKAFAFSADSTMLAVVKNDSVEVFALETEDYWRFNVPVAGAIRGVTWYRDNHHLFLHYPDSIAFLDLDDRRLEDLQTVAQTEHAEYDPGANALYFLADQRLMRLDFPR